LVRLDTNGNQLWSVAIDANTLSPASVIVTPSGASVLHSVAGIGSWDAAGHLQWSDAVKTESSGSVAVDSAGAIYVPLPPSSAGEVSVQRYLSGAPTGAPLSLGAGTLPAAVATDPAGHLIASVRNGNSAHLVRESFAGVVDWARDEADSPSGGLVVSSSQGDLAWVRSWWGGSSQMRIDRIAAAGDGSSSGSLVHLFAQTTNPNWNAGGSPGAVAVRADGRIAVQGTYAGNAVGERVSFIEVFDP
jgi:hypothetical protein